MPPTAIFRKGNPPMADHTPVAAVAAGDVVVINMTVRIAHVPIPAGTLGALAQGGGTYDVPKATGAGTGLVDGTLVYWDNTAKVATTTSAGNRRLGYTVGASADADATLRVYHSPG